MNIHNEQENVLRAISELEDYAFIFLDIDGSIKTWNKGAQKIKGYTSDEILDKNFRLFYTEADQLTKKSDHLLERAMKEGKAQDEGWRVRKDGSTFWGNVTITAVHDENGNISGYAKLTRDLTEKKIAERVQLLDIKNKELEQFTYIASHDLQEPLRTVSNYIQIIEEDHTSELPENVLKYLKTITNATDRMSALVRSLLDFSRIGREKKITSFSCNLLIQNIINDLHVLIESTNTKIIIDDLPSINGYETEIGQLFQNLITNAIKFRKKELQSEIKMGYVDKGIHHEFYVRDNGIGIEEKHFDRIFQIFQKLKSDRSAEGYGIGLANCKKIVEIHSGKLWVESEFGKGSTFKFTIEKNLL